MSIQKQLLLQPDFRTMIKYVWKLAFRWQLSTGQIRTASKTGPRKLQETGAVITGWNIHDTELWNGLQRMMCHRAHGGKCASPSHMFHPFTFCWSLKWNSVSAFSRRGIGRSQLRRNSPAAACSNKAISIALKSPSPCCPQNPSSHAASFLFTSWCRPCVRH